MMSGCKCYWLDVTLSVVALKNSSFGLVVVDAVVVFAAAGFAAADVVAFAVVAFAAAGFASAL